MRKFVLAAFTCILFISAGYSQVPTLNPTCAYRPILEDLRAYEDSLALAKSVPVVREDYSLPGSNPASSGGKVYRIYRCSALLDSLTVLIGEVMFARATPPEVDTDAASSVTSSAATLNATITATGGAAVSATGFKYATNALLTSPTDVAGSGTTSPFTAALTGLTASTQYWAVGYATNAVGTSYGDTITFTTSAGSPPPPPPPSSFACGTSTVTYDEHNYSTIQIGSQCWFAENLRSDNYKDGTAIPGNLDDATWTTTSAGAQTVYGEGSSSFTGNGDEDANLAVYGRLYNWYAVNTGKLCPTGWRVPDESDYSALESALNHLFGGGGPGNVLKSSPGDTPPWDGTNSVGFLALPGGHRNFPNGNFDFEGANGYWWSSDPGVGNPWYRGLNSGNPAFLKGNGYNARSGFSVRCVNIEWAPRVDTDAAGSVTATEATLNATFTDFGTAVTATGFKYGTDAALSSPTDVAGSGTTSPFTAALTGLTASTQYWAVGYATNGVGTSYGDTITFTTSAGSPPPPPPPSSFACGSAVTYDGYNYWTLQIGSQCWFVENLRNENYADGTPIPGNLDDQTWFSTTSGARTVYGEGSSIVYDGSSDEVANLATYGRLYNWYAVNDPAGLCPTGWHVPTDAEWITLYNMTTDADDFKSNTEWDGIDTFGFAALPGGFRYYDGDFYQESLIASFWTSTEASNGAFSATMASGDQDLNIFDDYKELGLSVRCVQD